MHREVARGKAIPATARQVAFKWVYTPREFGQLNSLFRSKHGVVYTYELVKRYRVGWRTGARGGAGGNEGRAWYEITYTVNLRFGLTTVDRFTWTLSRRYSWLCTLLATVTSSWPLARLPLLLFFLLSSFALDRWWVTPTENVTFGTYFRATLLAARPRRISTSRGCVRKRLIYPRQSPLRSYKTNTSSSILSYSNSVWLSLGPL